MGKLSTKLTVNLTLTILLLIFFLSKPATSFASDPLSQWTTTLNLPFSLASHVSSVYNNKIFIFGGGSTDTLPTNIYSNINTNGSLQQWNNSITPPPVFWHTSATKENHVYLLGGAILPVESINSVYLGTYDQFGVISSWTRLSPLPRPLSLGATTIHDNNIYFAGGFTNGGDTYANVYKAQINTDGTIGSWSEVAPLPKALNGLGMIVDGNNLIVLGGVGQDGNYSSDVYTTSINQDGTLNGWHQTTSLPEPVYRSSVIRYNSNPSVLISVGGYNGSSFLDKAYYAKINTDGTIDQWYQSNQHLPQPLLGGAVAQSNNYLYILGGYNGAYLDTAYYTKLNPNAFLSTISFDDVLRDIHNAYLNKQIDNGIDVALSAYIKSSQRSYERGDKAASFLDLNNFIRQLNKFNETKIAPEAFSLLTSDASGLQTLINSL